MNGNKLSNPNCHITTCSIQQTKTTGFFKPYSSFSSSYTTKKSVIDKETSQMLDIMLTYDDLFVALSYRDKCHLPCSAIS